MTTWFSPRSGAESAAGPVDEVVAVDVPTAGVYAIEVTTDGASTLQVDQRP